MGDNVVRTTERKICLAGQLILDTHKGVDVDIRTKRNKEREIGINLIQTMG